MIDVNEIRHPAIALSGLTGVQTLYEPSSLICTPEGDVTQESG